MCSEDARRLRGLPPSWEQAVPESAIDGLKKRAESLAVALTRRGRRAEADELRRRAALLERADELHRHASSLETLVGLYRALAVFARERDPEVERLFVWAQAGMDQPSSAGHGPAFRETAALRNRAFRWLSTALVRAAP
jgi:hypothetical protein